MLGIIGAMDREIADLLKKMDHAEEASVGFTRYWSGELKGVRVCLARCGIGKVHAAVCALGMILRYQPEALLNIGVAGALRDEMQVGDMAVAGSAVQHDIDTTPIGDPLGLISGPNIVHVPCDEALSDLLVRAAGQCGFAVHRGAIATGDQFIADLKKKDQLRDAFGAAACDMEGGAIAQCCYETGVKYAALRAVSDTRLGDGREYGEKADFACEREQTVLEKFMELYKQSGEEKQHG